MIKSLTNRYVIEDQGAKSPFIIRASEDSEVFLPGSVEPDVRSHIERSIKKVNYRLE